MKSLGVITARYRSKRFPGKPCSDILGKPMIAWVYERSKQSSLDKLVVATDDYRIVNVCQNRGIPVVMTSPNHLASADRVAEVAAQYDVDLVMEIQGDEPMVCHEILNGLLCAAEGQTGAFNSFCAITEESEQFDANVVKVVVDIKGYALFLSRYPIPFDKEGRATYYKQQGFYCYDKQTILKYQFLPVGGCEKAEGIALLRLLENNIPVKMVYTERDTLSVDTPADIILVEQALARYAHNS